MEKIDLSSTRIEAYYIGYSSFLSHPIQFIVYAYLNNLNSVQHNPTNQHSTVIYQGNETDQNIVTLRCILCILAVTEYSELMLVVMMSVNELWTT